MLLGFEPWISALGIDEGDQGEVKPGGQTDDSLRFAQPVGMDVVPVPVGIVGVDPLLPDCGNGMPAQEADAADHGAVVAADPVTANLEEVVQDVAHVVERVGPLVMRGGFHRLPGLGVLGGRDLQTGDGAAAQANRFGLQ